MFGYVSLIDHTPIETRYRGSWYASSVDDGVVFVGWLPFLRHTQHIPSLSTVASLGYYSGNRWFTRFGVVAQFLIAVSTRSKLKNPLGYYHPSLG
jgi:hypothetical protein